jgi:hypothetical protein
MSSKNSTNPVIDGISLSAFLYAIAQQEGNSYSAVNPSSGALGKYQVLPSNVASWTKRALGYSLTPQQFLSSPAAQEKTVRDRLGGYFREYGPAGAASAWYSGDPKLATSTRPQPGGPSVAGYVKSVLGKARSVMKLKTISGVDPPSGSLFSEVVGVVEDAATHPSTWDPLGWIGSGLKHEVAVVITSVEKLTVEGLIVLAGVGIIVVGAYQAFKPQIDEDTVAAAAPLLAVA